MFDGFACGEGDHLVQTLDKAKGRNLAGEELAFKLGEKRVQLGLGMQAKAIHKKTGAVEDVVVYFGIIDYLQVRCSMRIACSMVVDLRQQLVSAPVQRSRRCLVGAHSSCM